MSEELKPKPCPFCGTLPRITKEGEALGYGLFADKWFIGCEECEKKRRLVYCSTRAFEIFTRAEIHNNAYFTDHTSEADAISHWNDRPGEKLLEDRVEELNKIQDLVDKYDEYDGQLSDVEFIEKMFSRVHKNDADIAELHFVNTELRQALRDICAIYQVYPDAEECGRKMYETAMSAITHLTKAE
jgi:hypothetical protein